MSGEGRGFPLGKANYGDIVIELQSQRNDSVLPGCYNMAFGDEWIFTLFDRWSCVRLKKRVAVVIPVYKQTPDCWEKATLKSISEKFPETDKYLIMPESLEEEAYHCYGCFLRRYPNRFFKSERSYTRLLLKKFFYLAFEDYEYILIIQPDVWLLKGEKEIIPFLESGFDYIGAPWTEGKTIYKYTFRGIGYFPRRISCPRVCYVGNGGLSLRRVQGVLGLLTRYRLMAFLWNKSGEDTFFAYYGQLKADFRIANVLQASQFALETDAEEQLKRGVRPIGIHAWQKYAPNISEWK